MNKKYQIIYPEEIPALIKDVEWIAIDQSTVSRKMLQIKEDFLRWLHEA